MNTTASERPTIPEDELIRSLCEARYSCNRCSCIECIAESLTNEEKLRLLRTFFGTRSAGQGLRALPSNYHHKDRGRLTHAGREGRLRDLFEKAIQAGMSPTSFAWAIIDLIIEEMSGFGS